MAKVVPERLRKEFGEKLEIFAFGTNALATAAMLRAGANEGATGENALVQNMSAMDIIVGTIGKAIDGAPAAIFIFETWHFGEEYPARKRIKAQKAAKAYTGEQDARPCQKACKVPLHRKPHIQDIVPRRPTPDKGGLRGFLLPECGRTDRPSG